MKASEIDKFLHQLSVESPWFPIHPLFWTTQHLELLHCNFQQVDRDVETLHSGINHHGNDLTRDAETLATTVLPTMKSISAQHLLCPQGSPLKRINGVPPFIYANRQVHLPECDVYLVNNKNRQTPLIVGFYHYNNVTKARKRTLSAPGHPGQGYNGPGTRICLRKLRQVTPPLWSEDPYLICVLLSLAQLQWRASLSRQPISILVRLLVTNMMDTTHAHVYEADFPSNVLQSLMTPTIYMGNITWPTIKHIEVPFKPYLSFSQRIIKCLVDDEYKPSTDAAIATATISRTDKQECNDADQ
ncbi:hypothetical protein F53441_1281 [Fusarium austroafricanum]|uniref:Uncharacterized protein n=1 Tax=Fusarium austroafricanum TaxID=2364996 RepID=A0A8H4KVS7_9HYPO|nr:hypothetical protein F53441_1281 [Fusarium austroafricanum]